MLSFLMFLSVLQIHPCDQPDQTTPTKGATVGWCHDMRDDGGLVMPSVAFRVSVNGTVTDLGTVAPLGNPNTTGLYYFEAPLTSAGLGRGQYPVFVVAYSPEGTSLPSATVTWQIGGPPNKPVKPRIGG